MQTEQTLYEDTKPARPSAEITSTWQQPDAAAKRTWYGPHPVDIRLTVPLLFGRVYVTVVAGYERRSTERLKAERRLHPLLRLGNILLLLAFGTLVGLALLSVVQLISFRVLV